MAEGRTSPEDYYSGHHDSIQHDAVSSNCYEEPVTKERRRRQKLSNKDSLFCQVCGDKANGYNFGAITCESCKAFFRRNALKNKDLRCNFENNCKIDPFTRKFCTSCRLKKCFDINMKKEWILDEDSLKKRKKLTRKSRESITEAHSPVGGAPLGCMSVGSVESGSGEYDMDLSGVGDQPMASSVTSLSMNASLGGASHPSMVAQPGQHGEFVSTATKSSSLASPDSLSYAAAVSGGGQGSSLYGLAANQDEAGPSEGGPVPLVAHDAAFMTELLEEHGKIGGRAGLKELERKDFSKFPTTGDMPDKPQLLNMADVFIRRIIKFVKTLPEFQQLPQSDQVALLKEGMTETLVLRSAISFDPTLHGFCIESKSSETKNLNVNILAQGFGNETYSEHMKFITTFNTIAKWDKPTLILAMIINLFSPDRPGLVSKETVHVAEERYSKLLQAYLQSIHPIVDARSIYPKLLIKLTDVRTYGEMTARQISRVGPNDIEPLMIEMFNLKDVPSSSSMEREEVKTSQTPPSPGDEEGERAPPAPPPQTLPPRQTLPSLHHMSFPPGMMPMQMQMPMGPGAMGGEAGAGVSGMMPSFAMHQAAAAAGMYGGVATRGAGMAAGGMSGVGAGSVTCVGSRAPVGSRGPLPMDEDVGGPNPGPPIKQETSSPADRME